LNRRTFISHAAFVAASFGYAPMAKAAASASIAHENPFEIALSQWSFKDEILGDSRGNVQRFKHMLQTDPDRVLQGSMDPRDIVVVARRLGVAAVDLVNVLWFGHGADGPWLRDFKKLAENEGVALVCLMCGELKRIGAKTKAERQASIDQHSSWLETASVLNCTQLRVNPYGEGTYLEQLKQCSEGLHILCERAQSMGIQLVVENHGHPGSNGAWLAMLVEKTAHKNLGVYLDLDNFFMGGWGIEPERRYDRKQGVLDLAEYTVGVSAKTKHFLPDGTEEFIDYDWCVNTLLERGFSGYMSAEYEGHALSNWKGSKATVRLLQSLQLKFTA
jgi:sugar phosphate isomerase/epimerase